MKEPYFWAAFGTGIGFFFFDVVGYPLLGIDLATWSQWLVILIIIEIGIVGTITILSIWDELR